MVGSGRAGVGQARPNTWRAVAQPRHGRGLLLGFVRSTAHTVWLTVDQRSWSMVLRQGPWWTEPIVISPRLGSCAPGARLRCSPCPFSSVLPRRAPAGDVLTGELPQRLRHPFEVGKSLPVPWRLQWWSQGDGWCILSLWSRRTVARAQPACGNGAGAAALASSVVRMGVTMLQRACWVGRGVLQGLRWLWPRRTAFRSCRRRR